MIYRSKCAGHTLIELLIAMTLSLLILAAITSINSLGLRTTLQQNKVVQIANQLRQSLQQFESDIRSVAATGCLMNKTSIRDLTFTRPVSVTNQLSHAWLAGNQNNNWYPHTPFFDNSQIHHDSDAIHLMFAVLPDQLTASNLNSQPQRVFYITNCLVAEITRGLNASLATAGNTQIYPLQSVIYYIREIDDELLLYRQYLSKTGNHRNEPLLDNISSLSIGYGELTSSDTLIFKTAENVIDWTKIKAVYLRIKLEIDSYTYAIGKVVELVDVNH